MIRILKVDRDDPARELGFELDWLLSVTTAERYELMLRRSIDAVQQMIRNRYLQPTQTVKRLARAVRRSRRERVPGTRIRSHHSRH